MSTRDVVALVASEIKAASSDLLLPNPPPINTSKAYSTLHSFLVGHPVTPPTASTPVAFHPSVDKLAAELTHIYRNTYAPTKDWHQSRGVYRLTPEQIASQDAKLLVLTAWLRKLLPVYDPNRFVSDWWESLLKPVLMIGRWKPLVDACTSITEELLCCEHWTWTTSGALPAIDQFRRIVVAAYLAERLKVWEREHSGDKEHDKANVAMRRSSQSSTNRLGAFWETVCKNNFERVLIAFGKSKAKVNILLGKQNGGCDVDRGRENSEGHICLLHAIAFREKGSRIAPISVSVQNYKQDLNIFGYISVRISLISQTNFARTSNIAFMF